MNVTMEKNGNVGGVITVSLEEKDYQDKVAKDLKTIGQRHHIDGFRAGKVPAGLLKKCLGSKCSQMSLTEKPLMHCLNISRMRS